MRDYTSINHVFFSVLLQAIANIPQIFHTPETNKTTIFRYFMKMCVLFSDGYIMVWYVYVYMNG